MSDMCGLVGIDICMFDDSLPGIRRKSLELPGAQLLKTSTQGCGTIMEEIDVVDPGDFDLGHSGNRSTRFDQFLRGVAGRLLQSFSQIETYGRRQFSQFDLRSL